MAYFGGLRVTKSESHDKTPYTVYYPHSIPSSGRKWTDPWYQVVSIDPARKNYALRIERRYHNGWIVPIVFDKVSIESDQQCDDINICNTYDILTNFLSKYDKFYGECHFIIIERQLPQNYKTTRIAQHSLSYFFIRLHDAPLLPSIIEVNPQLKGKMLGAPRGLTDKQLKTWAVEKARDLLTLRQDNFSLDVMSHFRNKQDDLADTVCQIEALFICWGLKATEAPSENSSKMEEMSIKLVPTTIVPNIDPVTGNPVVPKKTATKNVKKPVSTRSNNIKKTVDIDTTQNVKRTLSKNRKKTVPNDNNDTLPQNNSLVLVLPNLANTLPTTDDKIDSSQKITKRKSTKNSENSSLEKMLQTAPSRKSLLTS